MPASNQTVRSNMYQSSSFHVFLSHSKWKTTNTEGPRKHIHYFSPEDYRPKRGQGPKQIFIQFLEEGRQKQTPPEGVTANERLATEPLSRHFPSAGVIPGIEMMTVLIPDNPKD